MSKPSPQSRPSLPALVALLGTSAGLLALAVYQWLELIQVRAGHTPACAINDTFNCASVWNSTFAHNIHEYLGVPVAGLGVLWGLVALILSFLFAQRSRATGDGSTFSGAVKVWAIAGLLSCVTFVTASLQAKAVCLTCLGTYALVMGFAVTALGFLGKPLFPQPRDVVRGMGWVLVVSMPIYLGLLYPGQRTPRGMEPSLPQANAEDPNDLGKIVESLPEREKLAASWAREQWKKSQPLDVSMFPIHARKGNPDAPLKLVDFTDILCSHCAQFEEFMHEVEKVAPPENVSIEPRYYPIDGECNPDIAGSAKDGVRCYGARLQICSQKHPNFFLMRRELFQNQSKLNQGLMLAIATRHGLNAETLNACMKSPETAARLAEDIAYARKYKIEGTPLVLLNGKIAPFSPFFLMGMAMSGGNADAPFFQKLPPPPQD